MLKDLINKFVEQDDTAKSREAIEFMVGLEDEDYKRIIEAIKLYRRGNSLREECYAKAEAKLNGELGDNEVEVAETKLNYLVTEQKSEKGGDDE